jgi:hypothetical protein
MPLIVALGIVISLIAIAVLYTMWAFWPQAVGTGASAVKASTPQRIAYFGGHLSLSRQFLFFVVVACGGFIGGLIHSVRSLTWYVGNRNLRWSWIPFYLLLPLVGALGGTVFYLVLRAGLFSPSTSVDQTDPFGFTAVAVLVGLFSEMAMEKLHQVATNVFAEPPQGADHVARINRP